jgi:NADPH-dependent curcumin reductase CurA
LASEKTMPRAKDLVVVAGATGHVGGCVVQELL